MKKKQLIITLSIAMSLIIGAGLAIWSASSTSHNTANTPSPTATQDSDKIDYNPPTTEQVSAGDKTKQDTINTNQTQVDNSTPVQIVTSATSITSERVSLRLMIEGVHKGDCTITLTGPNGEVIVKTANTQSLASTTTCQGFDLLTSDLSRGKWSFVVKGYFEDGRKGQVTGEFSL